MKVKKRWLIGALAVLGVWFYQAKAQDFKPDPDAQLWLTAFQKELKPFRWEVKNPSPNFHHYLSFYYPNLKGYTHSAGLLPVSTPGFDEKIFIHAVQPNSPKGTFVMLHGYFVHSSYMRYVMQHVLEQGYRVVSVDLPGHGLSSGEKVSISDFRHYSQVIETLTQTHLHNLMGPKYILGHSTGGAAIIDYVLSRPKQPFDAVILGAPLVRSYLWDLSRVGHVMGSPFLQRLPRFLRETTKDPEFMTFAVKDPLQTPYTPVPWVTSLLSWNDQILPAYTSVKVPLLVIQGSEDTVVEWPYNLRFLAQKFENLETKVLPGVKHDLFWERPAIRQQIFSEMDRFLTRLNVSQTDS